ncbi:MAG: acyl-CoA dehydrogenase family protein [Peptococcaceae bacterium]|nr:acyl-CoA dehydrogenase family protein [Peptococcaceae bacterium]
MATSLPETRFSKGKPPSQKLSGAMAGKETDHPVPAGFLSRKLPEICRRAEKDPDYRPEFYRELAAHGIMGMAGPRPYGSSFSSRQMAAVFEAVARNSVGLAISLAAHTLCTYMVGRWGTGAQKKRWLPGLCRAEKLGAFCLTEPKAGSDARSMAMKALRSPGGYVLDGTKTFVTNGIEASVYMVMAGISPPEGGKKEAMAAFVVERPYPGVVVKPYRGRKVAFASFPNAIVRFAGCRVTKENLLGPEGSGWFQTSKALEVAKVNMGAIGVGLAEAAYRSAVDHAVRRRQFGRRIADFQAIQFMVADMHARIRAARLLVQDAADRIDAGLAGGYESALAKCFATDAAMQVVTDAIQVLGGHGLLTYPLEKNLWEAKLLQILEGTNQIQRVIVARSLLGQP